MSIVILMFAGCTNVAPPEWAGGGTRYASGYAGAVGEDTGGGGDTASTGGEGAPVLGTGSAEYTVANEAGEVFVTAGIAYEDDPDDVEGGDVHYTLYEGGELLESTTRRIVDANADPNTEALVADGVITWTTGEVDATKTHEVSVYVVDYTRNRSNESSITVTSE